jgi:hypothetical protein
MGGGRRKSLGNLDKAKPPDDSKPIGMCTLSEIAAHIKARSEVHFLMVFAHRMRDFYVVELDAYRSDSAEQAMRDTIECYLRGEYNVKRKKKNG